MSTPDLPDRPDARDRPRVGVDEWVAQFEGRRERATGVFGLIERAVERTPKAARLAAFVAAAALVPLFTDNVYVVRVGIDTLIYALLAVGLNVAVGFAGLLDLGYIAFFGFGAYSFALLSSDHYGVHWPAEASIPLIVAASAVLGLLLGLPSRRLLGDYLAIVTLFFGQAFVTFTTNGNSVSFLGLTGSTDLTGGPNGIPGIDSLNFFGVEVTSVKGYFYVGLVALALVLVALHLVSESRTGRAWRALREDPLAAELLGTPVNRLKLLAFAFGAAIAGLTGTIDGALLGGVFPDTFDLPLLITIYAMLILGGAGSLTGAVLGAITINVSLEMLRDADQARWIFYGVILLALLTRVRPWAKLAGLLGATIAFGYGVHAVVAATWPAGTKGHAGGDVIGRIVNSWVIHPATHRTKLGDIGFVVLIGAVLLLTLLRGWSRLIALVPALYLATFVWENRLVEDAAVTRLIMLGAILVVLMAARPQGLLGTSRVEIV